MKHTYFRDLVTLISFSSPALVPKSCLNQLEYFLTMKWMISALRTWSMDLVSPLPRIISSNQVRLDCIHVLLLLLFIFNLKSLAFTLTERTWLDQLTVRVTIILFRITEPSSAALYNQYKVCFYKKKYPLHGWHYILFICRQEAAVFHVPDYHLWQRKQSENGRRSFGGHKNHHSYSFSKFHLVISSLIYSRKVSHF